MESKHQSGDDADQKRERPAPPPELPADPGETYNPRGAFATRITFDSELEQAREDTESFPRYDDVQETSLPTAIVTPMGVPKSRAELPPIDSGFKLIRLLGMGGMGEVWEAIQRGLWRLVAVKRLRIDPTESTRQRDVSSMARTFQGEAMVAALLDHPNIVPVYDLGTDESGAPQLAMKLVKGESWEQLLRRDICTMEQEDYLSKHLPILMQVCQAVAFAHSRGIAHLDLKPSQVMIGEYGEVLLMDWGIALMVGEIPLEWKEEFPSHLYPLKENAPNPAGTPGYMAPEQTDDTPARIGFHTDTYLLGGTLFRILCGASPHAGSSAQAFENASLGNIREIEDQGLNRVPPKALLEIAYWAMNKEPKERPTVSEFHERLRDYMTGAKNRRESLAITEDISESEATPTNYRSFAEMLAQLGHARVLWPANPHYSRLREKLVTGYARLALERGDLTLARAESERIASSKTRRELLEEIGRREQRINAQRRRVAQLTAVLLALLLIVAAGTTIFNSRLSQANEEVSEQLVATTIARHAERKATELARQESSRARLLLADSLVSQGRYEEAVDELLTIPEENRHWEWGYTLTRATADLLTYPFEYRYWSPSRKYAIGYNSDEGLCLLNAESGRVLATIQEADLGEMVVAFSRDEQSFAIAGSGQPISIHKTVGGELIKTIPTQNPVTTLEFSPDSASLALGFRNGEVGTYNLGTGEEQSLPPHERYIRAIYWGSNRLVSISSDLVRRTNIEEADSEILYQTHSIESPFHPFFFDCDPQREYFAIAHQNFDAHYGAINEGPMSFVNIETKGLAISPISKTLIACGGTTFPQYRMVELPTGVQVNAAPIYPTRVEQARPPGFHGQDFLTVQFSADESRLLVYSRGYLEIQYFPSLVYPNEQQQILVENSKLITLAPHGQAVWEVGFDGKTRLRPLGSPYVGAKLPAGTASFSSDGTYVSAIASNWLEQREFDTGEIIFIGGRKYTLYLGSRTSSDGKNIFLPGYRGPDLFEIEKAERATGKILSHWKISDPLALFDLQADHELLAMVGDEFKTLTINQLQEETIERLSTFELGVAEEFTEIAWSPNSPRLVTATNMGRILVFEKNKVEPSVSLQLQQGEINSIRYSSTLNSWIAIGNGGSVHIIADEQITLGRTTQYNFEVQGTAISQDARLILAWPVQGEPELRRIDNNELVAKLSRKTFPMNRTQFLDNSSRIVASSGGAARFWSAESGVETFNIDTGFGGISRDGSRFIHMESMFDGTMMQIAPFQNSESSDSFRKRLDDWKIDRYRHWSSLRVRGQLPAQIQELEAIGESVSNPESIVSYDAFQALLLSADRTLTPAFKSGLTALSRFAMTQFITSNHHYDIILSSIFHIGLQRSPESATGIVGTAIVAVGARQALSFQEEDSIGDSSEVIRVVQPLENMARAYIIRGNRERAIAIAKYALSIRRISGYVDGPSADILRNLGSESPPAPPLEIRLGPAASISPQMLNLLNEELTTTDAKQLSESLDVAWNQHREDREAFLREHSPPLDWEAIIEEEQSSEYWDPLPKDLTFPEFIQDLRTQYEQALFPEGSLKAAVIAEQNRIDKLFAEE